MSINENGFYDSKVINYHDSRDIIDAVNTAIKIFGEMGYTEIEYMNSLSPTDDPSFTIERAPSYGIVPITYLRYLVVKGSQDAQIILIKLMFLDYKIGPTVDRDHHMPSNKKHDDKTRYICIDPVHKKIDALIQGEDIGKFVKTKGYSLYSEITIEELTGENI